MHRSELDKTKDTRGTEILSIIVKWENQGKQIGTKLLNHIKNLDKAKHAKLITVKTSGDPTYKPYALTRKLPEKSYLICLNIEGEWVEHK
jgi:hypothetical protein